MSILKSEFIFSCQLTLIIQAALYSEIRPESPIYQPHMFTYDKLNCVTGLLRYLTGK